MPNIRLLGGFFWHHAELIIAWEEVNSKSLSKGEKLLPVVKW
jgi:hypothetical protein